MVCISIYTAEEAGVEHVPLKLSQASGVPYYRQIVDQLADLIRGGQLAPGTQLPSVRDLAAQTLVSLITVRRAYSDLETAKLIVSRQGFGTFVADGVREALRDQALAEARAALAEAVGRARTLGLDVAAIRAIVEEVLGSLEAEDGRS
jgi:GntR family transcriptional regulator